MAGRFGGIYGMYLKMNEVNPKEHNTWPVGRENTRILTPGVHSIVKLKHYVRTTKKYTFFLRSITKMIQKFISIFSWVDIHGIYYIVKKMVIKFDDFFK